MDNVFNLHRAEVGDPVVAENTRVGLVAGQCVASIPDYLRSAAEVSLRYGISRISSEPHRQIWRVPFAGGKPLQVTRNGGRGADAAPGGEWIYYEALGPQPDLRRIRPDGSNDSPTVDARVPHLQHRATRGGVWFVNAGQNVTVDMLRLADGNGQERPSAHGEQEAAESPLVAFASASA
jgi:hypothetical protein